MNAKYARRLGAEWQEYCERFFRDVDGDNTSTAKENRSVLKMFRHLKVENDK